MRESCAKNAQNQEQNDVSVVQTRLHEKKEREQEKSCPKILIKGDQQAGISLR
jgi:hypothetical protein